MNSRQACALTLLALFAIRTPTHAAEPKRPNIIFVLTDDLGYGDVGAFFQNQRRDKGQRSEPWHLTPHLDTMAAEGIQLRGHYCPAPVCAPSRASLLLGVHQGHSNVRDNQFDKALENNLTVASVLKAAGYATAAIGKWGLQGGPGEKDPAADNAGPDQWPAFPTKRGFDFYYGYVRHRDGHFHYPKEDGRRVWENEREVSADLDGCYTTDLFTARAKKWIVDQRESHPDQPFFLYLAYDTPHAKLQLPPGEYPAGGGAKGGVQWLGRPGRMISTADGKPDSYMHPDYAGATWDHDRDSATPEQPWPDVYKRYATDVRRVDDCVGDLFALLRDLKIDDNTLVVFTSDNGPSQESYLPEQYHPTFFNSFGPHDGIKRDCWEGGIRVGALARWPAGVPAGRVSDAPCQAQDWMPTFAELAGVPVPARADGVSLVPTLSGSGTQQPSRVYIEYFLAGKTPNYAEFAPQHQGRPRQQMQALRIGDYIGVRYAIRSHSDPFEIYDITKDPQQKQDLGSRPEFTALQQEMHDTVLRVRRPDPGAKRPYDAEFVPALPAGEQALGVEWRAYDIAAPWVARVDGLPASASGEQAQLDLSHALKGRDFEMLFTGSIEVPADGEYTFRVAADTGALLRIHEATVIDLDRSYSEADEASGAIRLQKGRHPFRLYYLHHGADEPKLALHWSRPGEAPQEVPAGALWHTAAHVAQH